MVPNSQVLTPVAQLHLRHCAQQHVQSDTTIHTQTATPWTTATGPICGYT